jgi:ABC-type lipoprotein export system ATPase subunit
MAGGVRPVLERDEDEARDEGERTMMHLETPALSARSVRKEYGRDDGRVCPVDGISLDVASGESVAIVGPSGCGKSTLLHLLGGLERPTAGAIRLAGHAIEELPEAALARLRRHALGFVFQGFHLVEELTAIENVELPALLAGSSPKKAHERANDLLEQVGLADRAAHLPSAMSGGQRQRVAIARALVNEPLVVLADEPTGNLDSAATTEVLRLFEQLRANGQTLVIVTHDTRIAATADRLLAMRDGELVDETRLTGGTAGSLSTMVGLDG